MMRRYYQFSIESILHSFTEYLKRMPDRRGSFNDFSDRVVDYIFNDFSTLDINLGSINRNSYLSNIASVINSYLVDNKYTEINLYNSGRTAQKNKSEFEDAVIGLLMILSLVHRYEHMKKGGTGTITELLSYPVEKKTFSKEVE